MVDWIAWLKISLAVAGATLIAAAQSVEPSESVWIMVTAGGMLGVAIREDKSVTTIIVHAVLGVAIGIAAASLLEFTAHLPRTPVAFLAGLFGSRWTVAVNRDIDANPFSFLLKIFRRGT